MASTVDYLQDAPLAQIDYLKVLEEARSAPPLQRSPCKKRISARKSWWKKSSLFFWVKPFLASSCSMFTSNVAPPPPRGCHRKAASASGPLYTSSSSSSLLCGMPKPRSTSGPLVGPHGYAPRMNTDMDTDMDMAIAAPYVILKRRCHHTSPRVYSRAPLYIVS